MYAKSFPYRFLIYTPFPSFPETGKGVYYSQKNGKGAILFA